MRSAYLLLGAALARDSAPGLGARSPRRTKQPLSAAATAAERGDDEKAISGLVAAFAKAFNGGDAAAAAATFAEDALVVEEHGERIEGRAAMSRPARRVVRGQPRQHHRDQG